MRQIMHIMKRNGQHSENDGHVDTIEALVRRRDNSPECRLANRQLARIVWPWHDEDWSWSDVHE